jgi:Fe-S-cluster-containing dehydrogenase component
MKCDMCYDRTSVGKKPMCATVCPSQALFYGTREEIERLRPRSRPTNAFQFGRQTITTRVNLMVPREAPPQPVDVLSAMHAPPVSPHVTLEGLLASLDLGAAASSGD